MWAVVSTGVYGEVMCGQVWSVGVYGVSIGVHGEVMGGQVSTQKCIVKACVETGEGVSCVMDMIVSAWLCIVRAGISISMMTMAYVSTRVCIIYREGMCVDYGMFQ